MPEVNFKLSDSEKHDLIWSSLNTNFNEEGNWSVDCSVCDIYDDYALIFNYETCTYERAYYTKNEDNIVIGERVKAYIVDVTESELSALKALAALNGGTYENADVVFASVEELKNANSALETEKSEFEQKIIENENSIATLQTEKEGLQSSVNELTENVNNLNNELESLHTYKENIELNEKKAVIEKYTTLVSEEVISKYSEALSEYTARDLEKELAFEMVNSNPNLFTKNPEPQVQYVPKDEPLTGIEGIISKHKK